MLSWIESRRIALSVFQVLEETYQDLIDKYSFSGSLEEKMYFFHRILDHKAIETLLNYFSGFYWMDHWLIRKVGHSPEVFVVMNSSDGTERVARRIIGGHVISMAFLPPESRKIGDTFFSAVWAYEIKKYALAYTGGKLEFSNFKKGLPAKSLEDAIASIEFGGPEERDAVLEKTRNLLKKVRSVLAPGCFSLNMLYVALSNLHLHVDLRRDSADVSHYPPLYMFFRNLGGCWKVYENDQWYDVSELFLIPKKKVKMVAATTPELCKAALVHLPEKV